MAESRQRQSRRTREGAGNAAPETTAPGGAARTDWTREITPLSGGVRAPSETGIGGMEREPSQTVGAAEGGAENSGGEWLYSPGPGVTPQPGAPVLPSIFTQSMDSIGPDIENNQPPDVIEAPTTMEEVYRGSLKALLARNVGNYVVATFLIGTQGTVSWEGILYDVGNDYVAIYQTGRDQYIVSDLYSLKYVEFYDTQRRQLCDELLEGLEDGR